MPEKKEVIACYSYKIPKIAGTDGYVWLNSSQKKLLKGLDPSKMGCPSLLYWDVNEFQYVTVILGD